MNKISNQARTILDNITTAAKANAGTLCVCGHRTHSAVTGRCLAPHPGPYQAGDVVQFCKCKKLHPVIATPETAPTAES